jgi:hypothetical protein
MRVILNLAQEFEDVCAHYQDSGPSGKDIVTLVKLFGDKYDHISSDNISDFSSAWTEFLDEHKHQMTVYPMTGLVLYNLITYWDMGQMLFQALPALEKILVRDIVQDISDEINFRSGSAVLATE